MTGGTVGKALFIDKLHEEIYVNQRVADIKINNQLQARYIYFVILSPYVQELIKKNKNSTNDNISIEFINSILIPLPCKEEQVRICKRIKELLFQMKW